MSRQNQILHFHISKKRQISWLDKTAVVAAFLYPLTALPQVVQVFQGNVEGVSLFSWLGFILFSAFFMTYGLVHKIKPMIITNSLWLVIDGLVVAGLLAHNLIP